MVDNFDHTFFDIGVSDTAEFTSDEHGAEDLDEVFEIFFMEDGEFVLDVHLSECVDNVDIEWVVFEVVVSEFFTLGDVVQDILDEPADGIFREEIIIDDVREEEDDFLSDFVITVM